MGGYVTPLNGAYRMPSSLLLEMGALMASGSGDGGGGGEKREKKRKKNMILLIDNI